MWNDVCHMLHCRWQNHMKAIGQGYWLNITLVDILAAYHELDDLYILGRVIRGFLGFLWRHKGAERVPQYRRRINGSPLDAWYAKTIWVFVILAIPEKRSWKPLSIIFLHFHSIRVNFSLQADKKVCFQPCLDLLVFPRKSVAVVAQWYNFLL